MVSCGLFSYPGQEIHWTGTLPMGFSAPRPVKFYHHGKIFTPLDHLSATIYQE